MTSLQIHISVWFNTINTIAGVEGGGVLKKCLYGEAPPRGPTPYPFIYHFSQKRYLFCTLSIDKWYPFHIPCLELCIPLTAVNALSFKQESIAKTECFLNFLKP